MVADGEMDTTGAIALLTPELVITAGVLLLIFCVVATVLLWVTVRRVRRHRLGPKALRALRATTGGASGRRLAAQRRRLERAVRATNAALASAASRRDSAGDLPRIAAALARTAQTLDNQLQAAAQDPDPAAREQAAAALGPHVDQAIGAASQIRQQLTRTQLAVTADELEQATRELDHEVKALDTWVSTYHGLR